MKKIYLYIIVVMWIMLAGKAMFSRFGAKTVTLDKVFVKEGLENIGSSVEGTGCYGVRFLSEEEKIALLKNIAYGMGMAPDYDVSVYEKDNLEYMTLTRHATHADVILKLITEKKHNGAGTIIATQYITVKVDMPDSIDSAEYYYEIIGDCFDNLRIDGSVCINLYGCRNGMLNIAEKNSLADELLLKLSAKVVAENRENDMFTIYGYTEKISDYLEIGNNRINVNIAINYDEIAGKTNIYLSTPINSSSY